MFVSIVLGASSVGITEATNQLRQKNGMPALKENSYLDAACYAYARTLQVTGILTHDQPGQSFQQRMAGYGLTTCAENISQDPSTDDNSIVQLWDSDAPHRANLLSNNIYIGVGISGEYYVSLYCGDLPSIASISQQVPSSQSMFTKAGPLLPTSISPIISSVTSIPTKTVTPTIQKIGPILTNPDDTYKTPKSKTTLVGAYVVPTQNTHPETHAAVYSSSISRDLFTGYVLVAFF